MNQKTEKKTEVNQKTEKKTVKKKKIVAFFTPYLKATFSYNLVDEDGNTIYKTNPQNGNVLYDGQGRKVPITGTVRFDVVNPKWSRGYLSKIEIDVNDESPLNKKKVEALLKMSKDRAVNVWEESEYVKRTNPEKFAEMQKNIKLHERLEAAEAKASKVEELEAKLAKLEKGK